ncbi:MAG: MAPEG family protein [Nevskiales bacterium]|nr:MAPEG family protein [Nevskiales bacterium]
MSVFAVYVLCTGLLVTLLALNVSRMRIRLRIANGDGGNVLMKSAIRAHANAVEHVTIQGLIVLALELRQITALPLAVVAGGFCIARLLHAWGMLGHAFQLRRIGAGGTYLAELGGLLLLGLQLSGAI